MCKGKTGGVRGQKVSVMKKLKKVYSKLALRHWFN